MFNPFGMNNIRSGFGQQSNQPYNFKGLESRLGKIETGISGLTKQFGNFQMPGQEMVKPEYTGNTTPNPLAPEEPTGGIQSLPDTTPNPMAPNPMTPTAPSGGIQSLPEAQNTGFNFDPSGGSLFDQMSTAYGQPATMQQQYQQQNPNSNHYLRGGQDFTQGFQDFIGQQGYHVQNNSAIDAGMNISQTPTQITGKGMAPGINGLASLINQKGYQV
jgi:hypothetical protein|tara:strand:+ start:657 stop:1304 length:648 start_codon:yes stop_codon:yes gene_type:complete